MGVTTGRDELPHPAIRAAAARAAPAFANGTSAWPAFMGKSLIQFFPAYFVIVNQTGGVQTYPHLLQFLREASNAPSASAGPPFRASNSTPAALSI
jgi:hypothetical protein